MAITFSIVNVGRNRIRILLTSTSAGTDTGTITTANLAVAVADDLGPRGPLAAIINAPTNGYGAFSAGAMTQAQARALYLSDRSGADPGVPATALCRLSPAAGVTANWYVDANVSAGVPILSLQSIGVDSTGSCYLDIYIPDTIGE